MGSPNFFSWVHFEEPTTKIRMKNVQNLCRFVFRTMFYLVVRRVEEEAFYQLGEVDIMACWSGLQPEYDTSEFVDRVV